MKRPPHPNSLANLKPFRSGDDPRRFKGPDPNRKILSDRLAEILTQSCADIGITDGLMDGADPARVNVADEMMRRLVVAAMQSKPWAVAVVYERVEGKKLERVSVDQLSRVDVVWPWELNNP